MYDNEYASARSGLVTATKAKEMSDILFCLILGLFVGAWRQVHSVPYTQTTGK